MEQLIRRAKRGDPDAFVALMDENLQDMYKVATAYLKREEDIADAIQDTILTCYEKIDTLKQNRYFRTWLIRILINHCNDCLRRRKQMNSTEVIPEQAVWEPEYEKLEWSECLKTLDEKYRLVLLLYYMEDFNAREIAQLLEMNEKTVQTRLKRGREKLTEQYHFQERGVSI